MDSGTIPASPVRPKTSTYAEVVGSASPDSLTTTAKTPQREEPQNDLWPTEPQPKPRKYWSEWAFLKMLLKNSTADRIIATLDNPTLRASVLGSASMHLSPPGSYFPGTKERVLAIRAPSFDCVVRTARFITRLVHDGIVGQTRDDKPMVKFAVPRKVIGTIIGRGGLHIQKLRQGTSAHIHISPLFVESEAACGERVISVVSRDLLSLRTASETLIALINQHPDRAHCRRIIYSSDISPDNIVVLRGTDLADSCGSFDTLCPPTQPLSFMYPASAVLLAAMVYLIANFAASKSSLDQ